MSRLYEDVTRKPAYWDRRSSSSPQEWFDALTASTVLYVGNLPFAITEEQVYEHFAVAGTIVRLVLGLNQKEKCSCGFAFVQYATHDQASYAHSLLNMSTLCDRPIRCDWDSGKGILSDRKYGRGASGMQMRDEQHLRF